MAKKKINWFKLLRLLGLVLFVFVLVRIDVNKAWEAIKTAKVKYLLVAIVFQLLVLLIKAVRWHLLNAQNNSKKAWIKSMGTFFESYAIGVITPGRLGELMKAGHENVRSNKIGSIFRIIAERGFDIGFFLLFAGISLYFFTHIQIANTYKIIIISASILIILFAFIILLSKRFIKYLERIINNLRFIKKEFSIQITTYPPKKIASIFLLSLTSNLAYFVSCAFLAWSLAAPIGFFEVSGGVSIAGMFNMLPITIMGLGTREITFLYVFSGNPEGVILAFSFLVFLVAQIGGGLISMITGQFLLLRLKKLEDNG
jgi:hypothetical protein